MEVGDDGKYYLEVTIRGESRGIESKCAHRMGPG
jgi:hypothetical protein